MPHLNAMKRKRLKKKDKRTHENTAPKSSSPSELGTALARRFCFITEHSERCSSERRRKVPCHVLLIRRTESVLQTLSELEILTGRQ